MKKIVFFIISFCIVIFCYNCKNNSKNVNSNFKNEPYEKLSKYNFFKGDIKNLLPNEGVLPYDLNSTLFTDYALKARFVWMPKGTSAKYDSVEVLDFPIGTVLIKNFYYPNDFRDEKKGRNIMETRLLIKKSDKWDALTYVWNDEQTDAFLEIAGDDKKVKWIDKNGVEQNTTYAIPNKNQCKGCHSVNEELVPIGPKVRNLNKNYTYTDGIKNQLEKWTAVGYLSNYDKTKIHPKNAVWDDSTTGTLDARAKAYLEINCGHCHRKEGPANTSGLWLMVTETNPESWGIMKSPVAAGAGSGDFLYDVVPGKPHESIMTYRMDNNTNPAVMMPELGRRLLHKEGVELIQQWIANMK